MFVARDHPYPTTLDDQDAHGCDAMDHGAWWPSEDDGPRPACRAVAHVASCHAPCPNGLDGAADHWRDDSMMMMMMAMGQDDFWWTHADPTRTSSGCNLEMTNAHVDLGSKCPKTSICRREAHDR